MSKEFERFAGTCAMLVAAGSILYSVTFVWKNQDGPRFTHGATAILLLLGGLIGSVVLIAIYGRLREAEPGIAMWALVMGLASALGAVIHGGYDLANFTNQPDTVLDLPQAADPRGLLTFGLAGLALLALAWLIARGGRLPAQLVPLGYLSGTLLILTYLGRLIILDSKNPALLGAAGLEGLVVNPLFYYRLGLALKGNPAAPPK